MTLAEKITDALKKYHAKFKTKVLHTMEEVEANTDSDNLVAAEVVGELNRSLPQWQYDDTGKIKGYTTQIGGADTVFPFISKLTIPLLRCDMSAGATASAAGSIDISKYKKVTFGSIVCTGTWAYFQCNFDGTNALSFPTGTNKVNAVYDIADFKQMNYNFNCQAGNAVVQDIIFE